MAVVDAGATPRTFASGLFDLSTLNAGPSWTVTITPTVDLSTTGSTPTGYDGDQAILATASNGGLYLSSRKVALYNGTGSGTLVVESSTLTAGPGQPIKIDVNIAAGTNASSLVISGATAGNGTYPFTDTGGYFDASTLGVGQYTNSGTFSFVGAVGAVTTGVNLATSSAAATCTATSGARAVTTGTSSAAATCTAAVAGSTIATSSAAATCTATSGARAVTTGTSSAVATCTAAVAGVTGPVTLHSSTSSIALYGVTGGTTLTAPGGKPLTGGGTIDPDGRTLVDWDPPASGSAFVAFVARPIAATKTISDSQANSYSLIDVQQYQPASDWETAVYEARPATGGAATVVTIPNLVDEEATLIVAALEGALVLHDSATSYSSTATTIASAAVEASGPALLLFCWCGDGPTLGGDTEGVPLTITPTTPGVEVVDARIVNHNGGWIQMWLASLEVATAGTYSISVTQGRAEGARWYALAYQAQEFVPVAGSSSAAATCTATSGARAVTTGTSSAAATCTAAAGARVLTTGLSAALATCTAAVAGASVAATCAALATCTATSAARAVTTGVAAAAGSATAVSGARAVTTGLCTAVATCTATSAAVGVALASCAATTSAAVVARAVTTGLAACAATAADATAVATSVAWSRARATLTETRARATLEDG